MVFNVDFISPTGISVTYTGFQITNILPSSFVLVLSSLLPPLPVFSVIYTFEFISLELKSVHLIE